MVDDFRDKLGRAPDFQGRLMRLEQAHIGYYRAVGEGQQSPASPYAPLTADLELKIAKHMENCITQIIDRVEHTIKKIEILKEIAALRLTGDSGAILQDIQFATGAAAISLGWVDTHCDNPTITPYLSKDFMHEAFPRKETLGRAIESHAHSAAAAVQSNIMPIDRDMRGQPLLDALSDTRADLNFMAGMQADVKLVFAEQIMESLRDGTLSPDSQAFTQIFDMSPIHYMAAAIPAIHQQLMAVGRERRDIEIAGDDRYRPVRLQLKPLDLQF